MRISLAVTTNTPWCNAAEAAKAHIEDHGKSGAARA
jgi:hypothetical protein